MKAELSDFRTGWYGLSLELSALEIDEFIRALKSIKGSSGHFHFRSSFEGEPGVGDIEVSCSGQAQSGNLVLEQSRIVEPNE